MAIKKLIEVALPLEKINAESAREKSIRHGHPSTLHLWWARRPLAAARAVIWSSLVDDPSSHPERFPTEEEQNAERQRLFRILEELVVWENSNNPEVLDRAKAEILKSTNNNPPALLDPFAGGGAIPLEAQRLGLEAHAHDLNPVAVMINKAMIEIPPRFANQRPVNPDSRMKLTNSWRGAQGLAEDVRYYGEWMKQEAFKRIGHLYPKVKIPAAQGGGEATVIAWIRFAVRSGKCPKEKESPKQGRSAIFRCPICGEITTDNYVKDNGKAHRIGSQLMAVVAEGTRGRLYLSPSEEQELAANVPQPESYPTGAMPENPRWFSPPAFGMTDYSDLFTNRQLTALTTFSDLVAEAQEKATQDAVAAGMNNDYVSLAEGGCGALAYGQAVGVYLAFVVDKMTDYHSTICSWHNSKELIRNTFGRQAIPMVWDYAEANPYSHSAGCFDNMLEWVAKSANLLPASTSSEVLQFDAQSDCGLRDIMVSTDPPYYDNIGYADLSDFFYVWMRRSLKDSYPSVFRTMLVPKAEELIATPYRHDGDVQKAKSFFEDGMLSNEPGEASASSGWETMLSAIIQAGFAITGTWPMRTEMANRSIASGTNALASSIVLVCRKRPEDAPTITRRSLIAQLKRELRPALQKLQRRLPGHPHQGQESQDQQEQQTSAEAGGQDEDGSPMTVRSALQIINQELDVYFNEQDGELDRDSRFCVELYSQFAFNDMKFGDADTLARAKNTSVAALASAGVVSAAKGVVRLLGREELPDHVKLDERCIWLLTQQLTRAMETAGILGCAQILAPMFGSNGEQAKDLAYRLYTIAERKGWATEAYAYNALVIAWPDIQSKAAELQKLEPEQLSMF